MARRTFHQSHADEPNVWPAFTDTFLLMASIFLIMSVASILVARNLDAEIGGGNSGDQIIAMTYQIPEGILFPSGGSSLKPESARTITNILRDVPKHLSELGDYARKQHWKDYYIVIEVAGHTDSDNMPSRSRPGADGNWELSSDRAISVVDMMEHELRRDRSLKRDIGVSWDPNTGEPPNHSTIIRASGYSSHMPYLSYEHQANYPHSELKARNRRIEIRIFAEPSWILKQTAQISSTPAYIGRQKSKVDVH